MTIGIHFPQVTLEVDVGRRVAWRVFPSDVVADRTLTIRVCTEDLVRRHGVCGCGAALRAGDGGVTLAGGFVGWNESVCLRPEDALDFDPVRVCLLVPTVCRAPSCCVRFHANFDKGQSGAPTSARGNR